MHLDLDRAQSFGNPNFDDMGFWGFGRCCLCFQVPRTARNKCHRLSDFKNRNLFSQFWRLEVQKEVVSRAALPLTALGEDPSSRSRPAVAADLPALGVWRHRSGLCPWRYMVFPPRVFLGRTTSQTGPVPTHTASFCLLASLKALSPNPVTF